jgi:hypothetical protein
MNESLTSYEAIDLYLTIAGQMDQLINYWISASFAVILSAFVGKNHLNLPIAAAISILYLLVCILFALRASDTIEIFAVVENIRPIDRDTGGVFETRFVTFLVGCLITQMYLWVCYIKKDSKEISN